MDYTSLTGPFRFFFGASYGSAQTALKRCDEQHVMISHATKNNRVWDPYTHHAKSGTPTVFLDNGAYSLFANGKTYETSVEEYIEYVADAVDSVGDETSIYCTLRDLTCDDDSLATTGNTVFEQQAQTVEYHAECLAALQDAGVGYQPGSRDVRAYTVLQGQTPRDYVRHLEMHRHAGTLTWNVGIGTLAGRPIEETEAIVEAVHEALHPERARFLHGYGITPRQLQSQYLRMQLRTADSSKWSFCQYDRIHSDERTCHVMMKEYVDTKRQLHAQFGHDHAEWNPHLVENNDIDLDMVDDIIETEGLRAY